MSWKIRVSYDGEPGGELQVVAYAFDSRGKFLAQAPIKNGKAKFDLDPSQAKRARLLLGPAAPEDLRVDRPPTLEQLQRSNAFEAVRRPVGGDRFEELLPIPELNWSWWLWCQCRVRGRVVRPVDIGGTVQDLPVCHARVHICEVDHLPWLLQQLPKKDIFRLRDDLLNIVEQPFPRPLPDPPPFQLDPRVIDPTPINIVDRRPRIRLSPFDAGRRSLPELSRAEPSLTSDNHLLDRADLVSGLRLDPDLHGALISNSVTVVRRGLIKRYRFLFPYLCYWPWFLRRLRCDQIRVVETDSQGCFDTTIFYPCAGDQPDLYFWVEAMVGGSWTTIYKPALACNTYWNYDCGSTVTLRTHDPRAPICQDPDELPGRQIAIMSIGNGVSIAEIQGAAAGANEGLTTSGQPFGARLEPHVVFGRSGLASAGIDHYRWSYRRLTNASGGAVSDSWHAMDRTVIRHYGVIDPTPPDFPLTFHPHILGPDPAHPGLNLFEIQGDAPAGSIGWTPIDAREDSASAFFQTHLLAGGDVAAAAGNYELKFELFKSDGSLANLSSESVLVKEAADPAPFGAGIVNTIPAPNEHLLRNGAGDVVGFRINLRLDNNPCEAEIIATTGSGLSIDADCGFIEYQAGASVDLAFEASHPNNFANFRFSTFRGPSIDVPEASAPQEGQPAASVGSPVVNGFVRDAASVFSKSVQVSTMLTSNKPAGSDDCDSAAFAETLHVTALATDGWSRLQHLDRSGTPKAFALAPATTTP